MSTNKIIIDGKEFNLPQELVDEIKSKLSTESKEKEMEEFFLSCFNGAEILLKDNGICYKKDGEVIMKQDLKNQYFLFNYGKIWSVFYEKFNQEYYITQNFIKSMLEKHMKLGSYNPIVIYLEIF